MPQNGRGHSSTNQSISGRDENYLRAKKHWQNSKAEQSKIKESKVWVAVCIIMGWPRPARMRFWVLSRLPSGPQYVPPSVSRIGWT